MTDKQKEAVKVLNKIKEDLKEYGPSMNEDDYMTVLEAIVENNVLYPPYIPTIPQPLEPYYQKEWTTTSTENTKQ